MKKLQFVIGLFTVILCFGSISLEAQTAQDKAEKVKVKSEMKDRKSFRQAKKQNLKKSISKTEVQERIKPLNARDAKVKKGAKSAPSGLKRASKAAPKKANGNTRLGKKTSASMTDAKKAIVDGRRQSKEMRAKIATARAKFEAEKKAGKYSKAEVAEKERKLQAAEKKVDELETTLKEKTGTISNLKK